jgi:aquaporin Z
MNIPGILAEFIGTTIFLLVIIITGNPWLIGLSLALIILILGPVSGGYFNPAVTIMMVIAKKESKYHLIPYIFAQILAAPIAYLIYRYMK